MTDRLNELRRQRDLAKRHLDWLDAEIAAAAETKPAQIRGADAARPAASGHAPAEAEGDAESLLRRYGSDSRDSAARVKRGCWIVFAGSFVVLGLALSAWFIFRR